MIIDLEVWKEVIGYEGIYEISCRGDLRRVKTQKILVGGIAGAGYVKADLWKNGKRYQTYIHRLVAQAFIGSIDGFEINHIDGNKLNNRVNNLEIVTKSENEKHSRNVLGNLCKPVIATDLETGIKTRYNSIMEASKDGFHESSIYKCCYGKLNKHKQKTWRFENPVHANRQKLKTNPTPDSAQPCQECKNLKHDLEGYMDANKALINKEWQGFNVQEVNNLMAMLDVDAGIIHAIEQELKRKNT